MSEWIAKDMCTKLQKVNTNQIHWKLLQEAPVCIVLRYLTVRIRCTFFWQVYKKNTKPTKKLPCKMKVECQTHPGASTIESQPLEGDHAHI